MQTGGGEEVGSWPTKPPLLLRPRDGPRPVVPAHSAERGLGARACSMEKRLAEFRAARQASAAPPAPPPPPPPAKTPRAEATAGKELAPPPPEESSQSPKAQAATTPLPWWTHSFFMNVTFLKFLLWLVLLGLFAELEFGLAYFVLSMFYWIYVGTRGPGERQTGEKSAYSVFNPGCEAIEGTLTAEQIERELQYQPLLWR